ncbi:MAG: hypothetical protein CTY39_04550 [Hyphomicrobium sp.]|nr:MAG: hypothetical protein CTY39_04550 [Hyphomicrobium sp.]
MMVDTVRDMENEDTEEAALTPLIANPVAPERVADRLLIALRDHAPQSVFDWPDPETQTSDDRDALLSSRKTAADLLVKSKLARFTDDTRTDLDITNAGRYWALHGGYLAYLKEEPPSSGGGGRQRNPEMESLRAEYMKLRLGTFWWSFGLSVAGFVMSIISVAIALFYGDRLLR